MMMNKTDRIILSDVNELIISKLQDYPEDVSELAIKAVRLAEDFNELTLYETLQELVREIVRKHGGEL